MKIRFSLKKNAQGSTELFYLRIKNRVYQIFWALPITSGNGFHQDSVDIFDDIYHFRWLQLGPLQIGVEIHERGAARLSIDF